MKCTVEAIDVVVVATIANKQFSPENDNSEIASLSLGCFYVRLRVCVCVLYYYIALQESFFLIIPSAFNSFHKPALHYIGTLLSSPWPTFIITQNKMICTCGNSASVMNQNNKKKKLF